MVGIICAENDGRRFRKLNLNTLKPAENSEMKMWHEQIKQYISEIGALGKNLALMERTQKKKKQRIYIDLHEEVNKANTFVQIKIMFFCEETEGKAYQRLV